MVEVFEDRAPLAARHLLNRCREGTTDALKSVTVHRLLPDSAIFLGTSNGLASPPDVASPPECLSSVLHFVLYACLSTAEPTFCPTDWHMMYVEYSDGGAVCAGTKGQVYKYGIMTIYITTMLELSLCLRMHQRLPSPSPRPSTWTAAIRYVSGMC